MQPKSFPGNLPENRICYPKWKNASIKMEDIKATFNSCINKLKENKKLYITNTEITKHCLQHSTTWKARKIQHNHIIKTLEKTKHENPRWVQNVIVDPSLKFPDTPQIVNGELTIAIPNCVINDSRENYKLASEDKISWSDDIKTCVEDHINKAYDIYTSTENHYEDLWNNSPDSELLKVLGYIKSDEHSLILEGPSKQCFWVITEKPNEITTQKKQTKETKKDPLSNVNQYIEDSKELNDTFCISGELLRQVIPFEPGVITVVTGILGEDTEITGQPAQKSIYDIDIKQIKKTCNEAEQIRKLATKNDYLKLIEMGGEMDFNSCTGMLSFLDYEINHDNHSNYIFEADLRFCTNAMDLCKEMTIEGSALSRLIKQCHESKSFLDKLPNPVRFDINNFELKPADTDDLKININDDGSVHFYIPEEVRMTVDTEDSNLEADDTGFYND